MRTSGPYNNPRKRNTNNTYIKISKGVYQRGYKSFHATKMVAGVITRVICTSKTAALKAYRSL